MAQKTSNLNLTRQQAPVYGGGQANDMLMFGAGGDEATAARNANTMAKANLAGTQATAGVERPRGYGDYFAGVGDTGAINSAHAAVGASSVAHTNAMKKNFEEVYKQGELGVDATIADAKRGVLDGIAKKAAEEGGDSVEAVRKLYSDPMLTATFLDAFIPKKEAYRDINNNINLDNFYADLRQSMIGFMERVDREGTKNVVGNAAGLAAESSGGQGFSGMFGGEGQPTQGQAQPAQQQSAQTQPAPNPMAKLASEPYKAVSGDSIESIAKKHETTPDALIAENPSLQTKGQIEVGQKILIPGEAMSPVDETSFAGNSQGQSSSSSTSTSSSYPARMDSDGVPVLNEDVRRQQMYGADPTAFAKLAAHSPEMYKEITGQEVFKGRDTDMMKDRTTRDANDAKRKQAAATQYSADAYRDLMVKNAAQRVQTGVGTQKSKLSTEIADINQQRDLALTGMYPNPQNNSENKHNKNMVRKRNILRVNGVDENQPLPADATPEVTQAYQLVTNGKQTIKDGGYVQNLTSMLEAKKQEALSAGYSWDNASNTIKYVDDKRRIPTATPDPNKQNTFEVDTYTPGQR